MSPDCHAAPVQFTGYRPKRDGNTRRARGTTATRYYQDNDQCKYANGAGQEGEFLASSGWAPAECADNYIYTAPVGSFGENHHDLFDMLGNALEWTQDCWHGNYNNAPAEGSARLDKDGGDCSRRVVRGAVRGVLCRAACGRLPVSKSSPMVPSDLGFRIARDF